MAEQVKFLVSHAPFWHIGTSLAEQSRHTMLAALPAVLAGFYYYGMPAVAVISLSISFAIGWELLMNRLMKRPVSIGDGNAAIIGLLFGMLLPAYAPWWIVLIGTFVAVVIGKEIYGGIGANPFNPVLLGLAILVVSWDSVLDFDSALNAYDFDFDTIYPLVASKFFGAARVADFTPAHLLLGKQIGGIGATFGIGIILGGIYLIGQGLIRWEISVSFLAGVFITALFFNMADPVRYAGPFFHLFTGYTLIGAFFLAPEESSSPVNRIPMLLYGLGAGIMTMLIRNIGAWVEGVVFAILLMNLINPLLDQIRPRAIGKVLENE